LIDVTQCVGCGACTAACKEENQLPGSPGAKLCATDYTVLEQHGDETFVRRMCMHCVHPSCASACPVGALRKTEDGPVIYDSKRCMGCRYCMVACPYGIPRYEWADTTPLVRKCQLCPQRVSKGQPTACAEACPTGATLFGERTQLIAEAWKRIAAEPDKYAQKVYGVEEAGGSCVLYIGPKTVLASVFPSRIPNESLPEKTWVVLSKIPAAVTVAGVGLLGVSWIINRRIALAKDTVSESGVETTHDQAGKGGLR
jgi:formate dehydrogenase iron-sulfur subunit